LQVLDINPPVSKGGDNDTLNLITSCFDCNSGKKATPLSRCDEIKKQQKQLIELNEKKIQLDMLMEWKRELIQFKLSEDKTAIDYLNSRIKSMGRLNGVGEARIKNAITKFSLNEVLEAIDISIEQYFIEGNNESLNNMLSKICGICYNRRHPEAGRVKYLLGIIIKEFAPKPDMEVELKNILKRLLDQGNSIEDLRDTILLSRSAYQLRQSLIEMED
jgi:hypothetical protein